MFPFSGNYDITWFSMSLSLLNMTLFDFFFLFWPLALFNSTYRLSSLHGLCLLKEKCLYASLKFSVCDIRASLKGAHVPVLDKPSVTRMLESSRFQADKRLFVCSMNRM